MGDLPRLRPRLGKRRTGGRGRPGPRLARLATRPSHQGDSALTALADALALAVQGLPVFPCQASKAPACAGGFKAATTDTDQVRALWARHPGPLIGVPTGKASGFDALDLDPRHGAAAWWGANRHRIPETRAHRTRSGGLHALFRHAEPVRNTAGKLGPGVDTRGEGGFIVWWPLHGCNATDSPLADWPDWLLRALRDRPAASATPHRTFARLDGPEAATRIADRILTRLASAPDGQRHYTLRKAAFTLGGLLDHLPFGETEAIDRLTRAVQDAGAVDLVLATRTAAWGLERGRANPLKLDGGRP